VTHDLALALHRPAPSAGALRVAKGVAHVSVAQAAAGGLIESRLAVFRVGFANCTPGRIGRRQGSAPPESEIRTSREEARPGHSGEAGLWGHPYADPLRVMD
jgi:hypothetical protein